MSSGEVSSLAIHVGWVYTCTTKWGMRQHPDILRQKHMSEISWGLRPDFVKCYFLVGWKCNHMDFPLHFAWAEETNANDLDLSSTFFPHRTQRI